MSFFAICNPCTTNVRLYSYFNFKPELKEIISQMKKTPLKPREQEIQKLTDVSQINYTDFFKNTNEIIILLDSFGNIISANNPAIDIYGYTHEEFCRLKIHNLRPTEDEGLVTRQIEKILHDGIMSFETLHIKKSGDVFPVDVSSSTLSFNNTRIIQSIIRDISVRNESDKSFNNNDRRYRLLSENSPVGIFHMDANGQTTYVNSRWSEITGMEFKHAIGNGWLNFVHPEDKQKVFINWPQIIKVDKINRSEFRFLRNNGTTVNVIGQVNPEKDSTGEIIGFIGTVTDITDIKKTEELLKISENKYRNLIETMPVGFYRSTPEGFFVDVNPAFVKMLGYKNKIELMNLNIPSNLYIVEEERETYKGSNEDFINQCEVYRLRKKDGSEIWMEDYSRYIKDENGNVIFHEGLCRDITDRKKADEELRKKEQQQSLILESLPIVFYTSKTNSSLATTWISEQVTRITGYEPDEFLKDSMFWAKQIHPEDYKSTVDEYSTVFKKGFAKAEYRWKCKDGSYRWFSDYLGIHYNEKEKPQEAIGFWIDITENKKSEIALIESEERYRKLVEHSPDGIFIHSEGVIKYINPSGIKIVGAATSCDIIGKSALEFVNPDKKHLISNKFKDLLKNNIPTSAIEEKLLKVDGSMIDVEVSGIPLIYEGKPALQVIFHDISGRKKTERDLKEQHNLLRTILDNSPDMIYYKDHQSVFRAANKSVASFMGTNHYDLLGKTDFDFYSPDLANQFYKDEKNIIDNGEMIVNKEELRLKKNGEKTWILTTKVPLFHDSGKVSGIVGISRDITERKLAEEKLKKSYKNWNKTFNSILDGIALFDHNQRVLQCNKSYLDIINKTQEETIGKHCYYNVHDTECPVNGCVFTKMQISKKRETMETIINGSYCEILVDPIFDADNKISGAVHIITDITHRKKIENALQEAKERAEEANRLKTNFLANMSHELRTPMTGILGFAEILYENLKDEEDKHKAEIILKGGHRLMNTLNLILDLSRIEADKTEVKMKTSNISALVKNSVKLFEVFAYDKNIGLSVFSGSNIMANIDEQLFEQVISNLVKNAITYTEKGFVKIEVKKIMEDSHFYVSVSVKDTGIGIPEHLLDIIFEPFRQVSEGRSREFEGTGLGLTLSKKYVELMKGKISVTSEIGRGSTFTVKFPAL